jgi:hypothetical protein
MFTGLGGGFFVVAVDAIVKRRRAMKKHEEGALDAADRRAMAPA